MVNYAVDEVLKSHFSFFVDEALKEEILQHGRIMHVKAGEMIIQYNDFIRIVPIVINGAIKVSREDPEGNELFLYYILPGESCAVSFSACVKTMRSAIKAIAEEDSELLVLPAQVVLKLFDKYSNWRSFVLQTFNSRFEELFRALDDVAFNKLDVRLIKYLSEKSVTLKTNTLQISHQDIAADLHTSREVVSRLLKQLENQGEVKLSRNRIDLLKS